MKEEAQFRGGEVVADRETSIQSLITVLQAVPELKSVGRQFKTFEEIGNTNFPAIIVEEDDSGEESIDYTSGGFGNVIFTVNIIGYVRASKNLATAINKLDVFIKKTLGTDFIITPTHTAEDSVMRSAGLEGFTIETLKEKSGTEFNPFGRFVRPIKLEYQGLVSEGL